MQKTAWVAGATGLIGGHLIEKLCQHESYEKVIALVRQPSHAHWSEHAKVEQWQVDYDHLETQLARPADDVFCALGSTSKKTPDKRLYYKIDVEYPLALAQAGLKHGARFFGVVSAHGANPRSLSFYLKMKGELEQKLRQLNYPHLAIARPSLLLGDRDEFRPLEKLSEWIMRRVPGNYKAIQAEAVAVALILEANSANEGVRILESASMQGASI